MQPEALTMKGQALDDLRRCAAEAEVARDWLTAAQVVPAAPGATAAPTSDNPSLEASAGCWARVRRVFGGGVG